MGDPSTIYDDKISITDIKTLAPGTAYNTITNIVPSQAANIRSVQVQKDYFSQAKLIDIKFNKIDQGMIGPVQNELMKYGDNGKVVGLVFGAFGDCSSSVHDLINLIARQRANQKAEETNTPIEEALGKSRYLIRKKLCLFIAREWARVLLDRLSAVANRRYLSVGEDLTFATFKLQQKKSQ